MPARGITLFCLRLCLAETRHARLQDQQHSARHLQRAGVTLKEIHSMNDLQRARGLGWFSIALGLAQVAAPQRLEQLLGVRNQQTLLRALGVRELITGIGLLAQSKPTVWQWGRVAGDLMDVGLLAAGLRSKAKQPHRLAGATGFVAAVGVLDLVCARQLGNR